ncbi:MAG: hypothetical protein ACRDGT_00660 [Candidatus Limnocylindria bacterium]
MLRIMDRREADRKRAAERKLNERRPKTPLELRDVVQFPTQADLDEPDP